MTITYDLVASSVLGSGAASITISSISSSYRDLILVFEGRSANGDFYPRLRYNGDTASNYSWVSAQGNGSAGSSFQGTAETGQQIANGVWFNTGTTVRGCIITQIFDYSRTDRQKTMLSRANRANESTEMLAGRWASNSAINQIQLYSSNGVLLPAGSAIYLYGIVG